ncbi:MAG: DUF2306 domain-containing protein [Bryobacteraceae bacterium]
MSGDTNRMPSTSSPVPPETTTSVPLTLRLGFWFSIAIAIAAVVRRMVALAGSPSRSDSPTRALDLVFAEHEALTLVHIVPALLFVLLAPIVILRKGSRLSWADKLLYPLGATVGLSAYAMSLYSIGGWLERSAVLVFNSAFLFSLWRAWQARQLGDAASERRWRVRAVVILLGIATTRPVMAIFFASRSLTHLEPQQFFGVAFWIGFAINTIIVEFWLRRRPVGAT